MDNSLQALCDAIKKILSQLKPQTNQLSFVVITGKNEQGKSALLRQSTLEEISVFSEKHAKIYFNQQGIVVELGEHWVSNSNALLQNTVKQLNRCHRSLRITGLILCVDINALMMSDPAQFAEHKKANLQILERFAYVLGYPVELSLVCTKMDTLAGFSEYYQADHAADLAKPLGFSLDCINTTSNKMEAFNQQYNWLIESLGQQVINKMHPARSTIKRSLIREFPLQLASLRAPILSLIQSIPSKCYNLNSIYFTSAEQGGVSIDRINKKIQHEYALVVQDTFPQATNYRAYFVEGALKTIQIQFTQAPPSKIAAQKPIMAIAASIAGIGLIYLSYSHYQTSQILDQASRELLAYDMLKNQGNSGAQALYHLSIAANEVDRISNLSLPNINQLKHQLSNKALQRLSNEFLPALSAELEQVMTNSGNTPLSRYQALKVYLMLAQPEHFSATEVMNWFHRLWHEPTTNNANKLALLKQILNKPLHGITTKAQVIADARTYLNALPTSYLYYSLAREYFPTTTQKFTIQGFNLAANEVPVYFTRAGFDEIIQRLPEISSKLQTDNWVLMRSDLSQLPTLLVQAYCFDYVNWWQTFMRKSRPLSYQDYQQGRLIAKTIHQANTMSLLIELVQQQTKPDLNSNTSPFNQYIAHKFTELNLISQSSSRELGLKIADLEQFIATLSVINDGGRTAFSIAKTRFTNEYATDPVTLLFNQSRQLPEPIKTWTKQLADDTWTILIKDSRQYINQQWQNTVYREFTNNIAKRYPFDSSQKNEINIADFNRFFATHGILNTFTNEYIKPFLDVSNAEWKPKAVNDSVMPISTESIDAMIRANIITNMFFPYQGEDSKVDFTLQKINLDPVVATLELEIGKIKLTDTQGSDSLTRFSWPQANAKLALNSIEGNHYELAEQGIWALFKLLEKVNVLIDEQDSSNLQILFEVNSNSGRYLLKTNNPINPFTPGILNGFTLNEAIV